MGTMDMKKVFELLEKYCPDAVWNVECGLDYIEKSVEVIETLGYLNKQQNKIR